jgi:hypothetical protein
VGLGLGTEAVRRLAKLWLVDDGRVRWGDNGFDWWPGRFRVSIRSQELPNASVGPAWCVMVRTAFLKDIPFDREDVRRSFFQFANGAASYAWVHAPAELAVRFSQRDVAESLAGRLAWFQSTVYVTETNAEWLPEFFGQLAILQPIDAEWQADVLAPILGAHPDFSEISNSGSDHADQILRVAQTTYMSAGHEPSRWRGSHEFVDAVERVGRNDLRRHGAGGA